MIFLLVHYFPYLIAQGNIFWMHRLLSWISWQGSKVPNIYKFQVLITTYEILLADCQELSEIEWRVVIIDEAHRLKNRNCKLLEGLKILDVVSYFLVT